MSTTKLQGVEWMARFNRAGIVHAFAPRGAQTSRCGALERQHASETNASRDARPCKRCAAWFKDNAP